VRQMAETPNKGNDGFAPIRRMTPAHTPSKPMITAMNGVHAPGTVAISEITIMDAPTTNPGTIPNAYPPTKVRVSVRPILIRIPKSGPEFDAKFPIPILDTAPTAIRTAARVMRCEGRD